MCSTVRLAPFVIMQIPCARTVRQGDWEVPSSREALDVDSPWNQVLRGQLPGLFLRCGGGRQALHAPRKDAPGETDTLPLYTDTLPVCMPRPSLRLRQARGMHPHAAPFVRTPGARPGEQRAHVPVPCRALDIFRRLPPVDRLEQQQHGAGGPAAAGGLGGSSGERQGAGGPAAGLGRAVELFWVDLWLRCVPLEGEAQGFFAGLPAR